MKIVILICLLLTLKFVPEGTADGDAILLKVDENVVSDYKITVSVMHVKSRRGERSIKSKSWIQGRIRSFTEYLEPAREAGTKMLKLEDQLWTYTPSTDRTIRISGHMLRQSVMGSDLSYEDLMEDPRLHNLYTASISGEDEIDGRRCYILDLTARESEIAYHRREIWVDMERYVIMKENRYAKSGRLLKTTVVGDIKNIEGRWVATRVLFKDLLKTGDGTEFTLESISFEQNIPDYIFSKASLRK
jgi:outer membrane lipoprotein-sorting protein